MDIKRKSNQFVSFENLEGSKCDYGCNRIAKYLTITNKKCCSEFHSQCPSVKEKYTKSRTGLKRDPSVGDNISKSKIGKKHKVPNKNKNKSLIEIVGQEKAKEILKSISIKNRIKIEDIRERYPFFKFDLRYDPNEPDEFILQCKCENPLCKNIWFSPRRELLYERIRNIKNNLNRGRLFCCEDCKKEFKKNNPKTKQIYINYERKSKFQKYRLEVDRLTEINVRRNRSKIINIDLRGKVTGYSLDHKLSVCYCFDNNVDPEIAAHVCNLEIIKTTKNQNKSKKSSITLEELVDEIKNSQ
jgi:hypothetical protein